MRRLIVLTAVVLGACQLNELGPWLDESGQRLEGSQVLMFMGLQTCEHESVTFLNFFGALYAKDPDGVLGELRNPEGEVLTFEWLPEVPTGLEETNITHRDREILIGADRTDYLYLSLGDGTAERWPRAEIDCDRPGGSITELG
jgi:hypothetical protein